MSRFGPFFPQRQKKFGRRGHADRRGRRDPSRRTGSATDCRLTGITCHAHSGAADLDAMRAAATLQTIDESRVCAAAARRRSQPRQHRHRLGRLVVRVPRIDRRRRAGEQELRITGAGSSVTEVTKLTWRKHGEKAHPTEQASTCPVGGGKD